MSNDKRSVSGSFWIGAIVIVVGTFLLLDRMDLGIYFPRWIFSIGSFFVALSLIVGIRKKFTGIGWIVLMFIGFFFLLREIPEIPREYRSYIFPVGVITVGLFILGRSILSSGAREAQKNSWNSDGFVTDDLGGEDFFDITTIFGSSKRKVFSKKFRGGKITSIFGGSDIDLTQADLEGTIVIDVVQLFGGVKLIIPSNWEMKSDVTAVFGGVEDKRAIQTTPGAGKKLVITGFVMFGGVDIKSY